MPKKSENDTFLSIEQQSQNDRRVKVFFSLSVTLKYLNNYETLCFLKALSFMVEWVCIPWDKW